MTCGGYLTYLLEKHKVVVVVVAAVVDVVVVDVAMRQDDLLMRYKKAVRLIFQGQGGD